MSLYTPKDFVGDAADAQMLMRAYPFATLVTTGAGATCITHLPLLCDADGTHGVLHGHMARANPQWQAFAAGETIAVFHGPHAYISPSWYVQPEREVPTWNYAAVHAHGRPQLIESREEKLTLIDRTTAHFESANTPAWTRSVDGERLEKMLDAIVAFAMPLTRVEAKFKMNQNKTPADRTKVTAQMRATAQPELGAMADWMDAHESR